MDNERKRCHKNFSNTAEEKRARQSHITKINMLLEEVELAQRQGI